MQEQEVQRFAEMMRGEWLKLVDQEGTAVRAQQANVDSEGELPCPACGTAAPLEDGACTDCGLQLA